MKQVTFSNDARLKLKKGVDLIANAIKVTLGPRGRNVIYGFAYGYPVITKDGVTVAQQVECQDQTEQLGMLLIREVAQKTADDAGDGTTTASILAQSIFNEGLKALSTGANPILIKRSLDTYSKIIIDYIAGFIKKDITNEDLLKVASISANNDTEIAGLIISAIDKAGPDGVITIEDNYQSGQTFIQTIEGMQLNQGYISPYFATDKTRMEAAYKDPYILIADYEINHIAPLMKVVEMVLGTEKRPLVIIANDLTGQALQTLVINTHKGGVPLLCCKSPYFGENRSDQLTDLAILTGGRVVGVSSGLTFDQIELADLGQCGAVVATKNYTTFTAGRGDAMAISARVKSIQTAIESTESDYEKEKLQERLAKLTSGVAVIKVGAATEVELKEKKMRIEDALHATRAAIEEGIVPGGGVALMRAARHLKDLIATHPALEGENARQILVKALQEPLKQIALNSGVDGSEIIANLSLSDNFQYGYNFLTNEYGDLFKEGVIDPFKVVRLTLENAISVAGMLLTTDCIINEDIEEETTRTPRPR